MMTFLVYSLLMTSSAYGQMTVLLGDEREQMIRDVMAAYPKEFKSIDILSMKKLDDHYLAMSYTSGGSEWEAILQIDGIDPILVESGKVIPPVKWRELIVEAVRQRGYATSSIERMLQVSNPYGEQGFRVDIHNDEMNEDDVHLYFDPFGNLGKPLY